MTDKADEAKTRAKTAAAEARSAGENTGRAVKAAAEAGAEAVVEEAQDAAEGVEAAAEDVIEAARRINLVDASMGVGALAVSIASGLVAYSKFRQAFAGGSNVVS